MKKEKVIIEHIENIFEATKGCKLEKSILDKIKSDATPIQKWLKIDTYEAIVIALSFGFNLNNESLNAYLMSEHLNCSVFRMARFQLAINSLIEKFYLEENFRRGLIFYSLNENLYKAILENNTDFKHEVSFDSTMSALEAFENLYKKLADNSIKQSVHKSLTIHYLNYAQELEFFKWVKALELSWRDQTLFLTTIWDYILGHDEVDAKNIVRQYLEQESNRMQMVQELVDGTSNLICKNLVEVVEKDFTDDLEIKLTAHVIQLLKDNGVNVDLYRVSKKRKFDVILSDKIYDKRLYYNFAENTQIENIARILSKDKFIEIQSALENKGLPKGVNILLYGSPGTGKTETVYQLARKTHRNVMKVDISSTKSAWFGESQKLIKKVFNNYTELIETEEMMPILLFNEADAIIGKRKAAGSSGVADTENAIQNIILEELENFQGIFMATTNLVDNMDAAFERRFLYKIKFDSPCSENKKMIWLSKTDILSEADAAYLANHYDFSGGQIENIIRKISMHEIIENSQPSFDQIVDFCENESWQNKERKKVGF